MGEAGDGDAVGEPAAGLVCAGLSRGDSAEVGPSSGVSGDEHDARVASITTTATTSRAAKKIMGQTLWPDALTRPGRDKIVSISLECLAVPWQGLRPHTPGLGSEMAVEMCRRVVVIPSRHHPGA